MATAVSMQANMKRSVVAAMALLSISCGSAKRNPVLDSYPASVSGSTSVLYYDVQGRTLGELHADMRKKGPKIDGNNFVGETRSPMRWRWRTESSGAGSCAIRDVTVYLNAQITLPRWTPPADAEPGLVTEWNRFLSALEAHEAGHKDISARAGKAIVDRLRGLSAPCSMLGTRANDLARDIFERAHAEQRTYDATTRHGLTQGTAFGGGRYVTNTADLMTLLAGPRPGTVRGLLPVPLVRAWAALPAAFAANGLTINAIDSAAYTAGDSMVVRGKIGTMAANDIIDCGTPPNGRHADSVAVSLFVTSRLERADSSSSTATNTVQAVARPPGVAPILCRSRGVLERRLLEELRSRLVSTTVRPT
jgi:predicted secreted Zn-dependent protease